MSGNPDYRKFQRVRDVGAALAVIEQEGGDLIRHVTRRESAKIIALRTGITPRHVYNLRDGECQPRWMHFLALAQQYPEIRAFIAKHLGFDQTPNAKATLDSIKKMIEEAQAMPEEGDQASGEP